MAKPVKRNKEAVSKIDYTNVKEGIYLDEVSFGEIHQMEKKFSNETFVDEYVYEGMLHSGEVKFITGDKLSIQIPSMGGYNHGYTLEGKAQEIFQVESALDVYSSDEMRTFNYTKEDSKLVFIGDQKKKYTLYVRFYDNCYGNLNNRWAVIYVKD